MMLPLPGRPDLQQLHSYLHQLVEQLNTLLPQLQTAPAPAVQTQTTTPGATFSSVKSLIIKSADIVGAYYEAIDRLLQLSGAYTASTEFGQFRQLTQLSLEGSSQKLELALSDIQSLSSQLSQVQSQTQGIRAYLRFGQLYLDENGMGVYGIELGQDTQVGDTLVFSKFLRLAAGKLSFYDENGTQVAYASGERFYCPVLDAQKLYLGDFMWFPRTNRNLSLRWTGG